MKSEDRKQGKTEGMKEGRTECRCRRVKGREERKTRMDGKHKVNAGQRKEGQRGLKDTRTHSKRKKRQHQG